MIEEQARKLAEEHWNWLEPILMLQLQLTRRLFIDAFIHGAKHASKENRVNADSK